MRSRLSRRAFATGLAGAALMRALPAEAQPSTQAESALAALESQQGGRLGVIAVDTASWRRIGYRSQERFAMCSTHKVLTVAAILSRVDRSGLTLDQPIRYGQADLLDYAPVTRKNLGAGFMTIGALCAAAIEWSDNTAANLLLGLIGGPAGWTGYARSIGDTMSRLDRIEPALNSAIPGDPRDTTTPAAMVQDLNQVLLGTVLSTGSRNHLESWMLEGQITNALLRAGVPSGWRVADKSGSGSNGTRNDIGIILRPKAAPILACVYYTGSKTSLSSQNQVIAETGRIIAQAFPA